jgi:hypothetical protein
MTPEAALTEMIDSRAIEHVMLDFGRALDTGDWTLYRSTFLDRIRVDFERLTGFGEIDVDADEWTEFARLILSPVRRHHQYSNFRATITGDEATALTYMVARHMRLTDRGSSENTQYGWYENSFTRTDAGWKISRLSHQFQWISGNDAMFDLNEPALATQMAKVFCEANRLTQ